MPKIKREYTIDLRLPAEDRWAKVIKAENRNADRLIDNAMQQIRDLAREEAEERLGKFLGKMAGPLAQRAIVALAKLLVPAIHTIRGGVFRDDIAAWSKLAGIDYKELVLANLSYELSQIRLPLPWFGCTALAFNRKGGGIAHVRNMDWPLEDCGRLSTIFHFKGGECGPFTSVGWPCFVGLISGVAPGRFSITLNQAPQVGIVNANWPAAFALRIVFEECETFDQAVRMLKHFNLAASALFMVVGTKRDQAAVVEHTGKKAHCRWMENGVLSLANHFETPKLKKHNPEIGAVGDGEVDPQEDSEERSEFAVESAGKGASLPVKKVLSLLNKWPVLFDGTAQRMAFVPKTGEYVAHYWR